MPERERYHACPTCFHELEVVETHFVGLEDHPFRARRCPRCGHTESMIGVLLSAPRHCSSCTCHPLASVAPATTVAA